MTDIACKDALHMVKFFVRFLSACGVTERRNNV